MTYGFYCELQILVFLLGFSLKSPGMGHVLGKDFDWPELGQVPNLGPVGLDCGQEVGSHENMAAPSGTKWL